MHPNTDESTTRCYTNTIYQYIIHYYEINGEITGMSYTQKFKDM